MEPTFASFQDERQFYQQRIAELEGQMAQRDAHIAALERQVADLQALVVKLFDQVAKLSKNSSNSSKPPSSDIVKPPSPPSPAGPRKTGGQPGHPGTHHHPFSREQLDAVQERFPARCPQGHDLTGQARQAPKILPQVAGGENPGDQLPKQFPPCRFEGCGRIVEAIHSTGPIKTVKDLRYTYTPPNFCLHRQTREVFVIGPPQGKVQHNGIESWFYPEYDKPQEMAFRTHIHGIT